MCVCVYVCMCVCVLALLCVACEWKMSGMKGLPFLSTYSLNGCVT